VRRLARNWSLTLRVSKAKIGLKLPKRSGIEWQSYPPSDMTAPLAAGGLVLDLGGALALVSSFMLKRPTDIEAEARMYWNFSPRLLISLPQQVADAWVGGALLSLGFGAQLAQSVGAEASWLCLAVTLPIAGAAVLLSWVMLPTALRPWWVHRAIEHHLEALRKAGRADEWRSQIVWLARMRGREIQAGERPADIGVWLIGRRRWKRLASTGPIPADMLTPYPG
jgi:hypothetical protein